MRQEKLEQLKAMIPFMRSMVDDDLAISIWDREGTVLFFQKADTFPLHFNVGFKLPDKNDKLFQAMNTGKTVHNVVPKEKFGIAIEGNLVPVFDEGEVVGCIACVFSKEKVAELENKTMEMHNMLLESKHSISDILNAAINTMSSLKEVHQFIDRLETSLKGIHKVVNDIKGNTSRTKMLALNASIEAARAGTSGVGFKIVANEMGKLSEMSTESVTHINATLDEMEKSITDVTKAVEQIDSVAFKNSGVVEKILSDLGRIE